MSFRRITLFVFLLPLVIVLYAQPNRYGLPFIQNYHYAETGGGERNWCIIQDQRGLIYVANNDKGILEFDGNSWRTLPVPGDVPVRSLVLGDDGYIYAGLDGEFGRLEPDRSGTLYYRSLLDSVQRETYAEVAFWRTYYKEDRVYTCGMQAILVFDVTTNEFSVIDPPENTFLTFFIGPQMYTSVFGNGLMKYDGNEFILVNGGGHFRGKNISGLVPLDSGRLLASTFSQKLYLLDTLDGSIDSTFLKSAVMEELATARMIYLQSLDKEIYIGTREEGLFVMDEKWEVKERISVNEGLLDNAVPYFHFDRDLGGEQTLWIALWKGISRVHIRSPFRSVSVGPGRGGMYGRGSGEIITDLNQFGGDLFVSTQGGLLRRQQNSDRIRFRPVWGIRDEVYDLQVVEPSPGTQFLLAASKERIFVLDRNMQMSTLPVGGQKLLVDRNNPELIYTGSDQFKALRYSNGQWEESLSVEIGNEIYGMCQDRYSLIWISTRSGLLRLQIQGENKASRKYYGPENGLPSGSFRLFTEPESQELLVGTREGFFRIDYDRDSLIYDSLYNSILPPGKNNIQTIHWGPDSLIWFSFENEQSGWNILAARRTDTGFQKVFVRPFLNLTPTVSTDVFYTDSEEELWFSKGNELIHFEEGQAIEAKYKYEVLIRNVKISDDSVLFGGTYFIKNTEGNIQPHFEQTEETQPRLKHIYRDIEFNWTAPYSMHERHIRYAYFLEGFSEEWSDWGRSRSTKFTNLPYGKYEIKVKARNAFGDESSVTSYAFSILRPWYANITALLLYFVLISSIVIFVIHYNRKLRSRAELLEKQNREIELQKEKLENLNEEITAQRDEIEAQRDSISGQKELIDRQKNAMTDSIHYARRIQDAVLPAREVMRYLLPRHFVFYEPRDIVSGDFFWVDKRDEIVLIAVADCTGHGVPGAFMSMLGISLLNEISSKFSDYPTNEIMDELRDQVMAALGQTGDKYEAKDGIEMSLLAINTKTREVQFTGANQNLYTFQKGKLVIIKGDRMPVGIDSEGGTLFSAQTIKLSRGDTLYMFTDGYPDQFGGPQRKKFGTPRLRGLLTKLQISIMHDQENTVVKEYETWKGDHEQIDDVLMIGIKV